MPIDEPVLTDPWWDLRGGGVEEDGARRDLAREIGEEIAPGHPLFGAAVEVVARHRARDDVLVKTADGRWALIHITWKHPDTPPWPSTTLLDSAKDVEQELAGRD
jgi:hypothetical protein